MFTILDKDRLTWGSRRGKIVNIVSPGTYEKVV